jgi:cephalosporin-C deacetylase
VGSHSPEFRALASSFFALLFLPAAAALAQPAAPPSQGALIELGADGGLVVTAAKYRARLGPDGNLHSLVAGETEFLDDSVSISLGCFFYSPAEGARRFSRLTSLPLYEVLASDETHSQRFHFSPEAIEITLRHSAPRPPSYYMVLSRAVELVSNADTGEAASAPATEPWGHVRLTASSGDFLEISGGSRLWGPLSERQVWELSQLAPGQAYHLQIRVGKGPPPRPGRAQLLGLTLSIAPPDQVVPQGGEIKLSLEVENRSTESLEGQTTLDLFGQREEVSQHVARPLSVAAKEKASAEFLLTLTDPDFYDALLQFRVEGKPVKRLRATFGCAPDRISVSPRPPPDLDSFWQEVSEGVRALPLKSELQLEAAASTPSTAVYRVSFDSVKGTRLSGWYCRPTAAGPHPALLYLPGPASAVAPAKVLADLGYVALTVRFPRPAASTQEAAGSYLLQALETPPAASPLEFYRDLAGHGLQALAFLREQPEVAGERIALIGAGEGAGLALLLSALDPRVAAVAADAPMPCDLELSLRSAAWPYRELAGRLKSRAEGGEDSSRWLAYVDVLNLAPRLRQPVLLSVGLRDPVALASSVYAFYNSLPGPKEIKLYPEAGHEGGGLPHWAYKLQWLNRLLKPPAPAKPAPSPPASP